MMDKTATRREAPLSARTPANDIAFLRLFSLDFCFLSRVVELDTAFLLVLCMIIVVPPTVGMLENAKCSVTLDSRLPLGSRRPAPGSKRFPRTRHTRPAPTPKTYRHGAHYCA